MAQDTTPAIVIHQGDGKNRVFSVPFDKGDYGVIKVAFVRRGLTEYEYNPTTYSVGGHLYAWALKDTDPVRYYYTKDSDNKAYDANNEVIEGVTVESMFDSSAVFSDGKTGYRARAKDIVSHALVEWLGKPLTADDWICIVRETTTNQPYTYPNNQKHVENALDNLSRQIQELKFQVESSLKVDPTYTQDPNKLDPIDWLNTIVRSNDGTARNLKYHDMWLEYSTDDPDFPEKEKTWTRLLNTVNITTLQEYYEEGTGKFRLQYSKNGGKTWINFGNEYQEQIDGIRTIIEEIKKDIKFLRDTKIDKDQGKNNVGKVLTVEGDGIVRPRATQGEGTGLNVVAHDDTLFGAGTDEWPLGVKDKVTITIVDWE